MIEHEPPAIRTDMLWAVVDGEGVALASDRMQRVLLGPLFHALFPLLDGSRTREEIMAELAGSFDPLGVRSALRKLDKLGCLRDGSCRPTDPPVRPPGATGSPGPPASRPAIELGTIGDLSLDQWSEALRAVGLEIRGSGEITLLLTDSYLRPELRAELMSSSRPCLPARPVGSEFWLGPLVRPEGRDQSERVLDRIQENRPVEGYLLGRTGRSPASLVSAHPEAFGRVLLELLDAGLPRELERCVVTADSSSGRADRHELEGSSREVRLTDLVDPVIGIATGVRAIEPWPDAGIHAAVATYAGRPTGPRLRALRVALKTGAGKGWTSGQAVRGAIGEVVERRSAGFRRDTPRRRAAFEELGQEAVDPQSVLLFSESQLAKRDEWNLSARRYHRIPEPLRLDQPIDWSPLRSLTTNRTRYLPTSMLYDDFPDSEPGHGQYEPNGTAAAPTREEAMLRALLEVIERDAIAIWWYNRIPRPRVTYRSAAGRPAAAIERAYAAIGREHWILDLTTDLGIPVFAAVSRRVDAPTEAPLFGFGCHLDPELALSQAIAELNQVIAMVQDFRSGPEGLGVEVASWLRTATVAGEPYLAPVEDGGQALADICNPGAGDIGRDLDRCRRAVEESGHEVLALDMSCPEWGVPVARVVVPGLRSFYARFAAGRLYDVPVTLGWLREPVAEDNLNPVAFLL